MSVTLKRIVKGIVLRGESTDVTENIEGSLFHNNSDARLKSYIEGAVRQIVTNSQSQVLTNKTIVAANNSITTAASGNLTATELNSALQELQLDIDTRTVSFQGTLTNGNILNPSRLDAKQDTLSVLIDYAASFTPPEGNGQIVYATDEKQMFQVVDGELVAIGGADILKITAGEDLSLRDLVYISLGTGADSSRTSGRLYKADASVDERAEVVGFISKPALAGNLAEVQLSGIVKGFSDLVPGKIYYASPSSSGAITITPPNINGQWIVAAGIALNTTNLNVNPVASAGAIYVEDRDFEFTIANNQLSAASVTGLLFDPISTRSFELDYVIYRQTDDAGSALAQVGKLRGVYNTQASIWYMSDDFSGQNSGVTFSIQPSGQIQYTSSNIIGSNYVGKLTYTIRKTFNI